MASLTNSEAIAWLILLLVPNLAAGSQPQSGLASPLLPFFALRMSTPNVSTMNVSATCFQYSMEYLGELSKFFNSSANVSEWALKMVDASAKIPTGIMEGNFKWLGSFTECLRINNEGRFSGQYCTASVGNVTSPAAFAQNNAIQSSDALSKMLTCNCVSVGFCWPSACNQTEIQWLIDSIGLPLSIQKDSCQTESQKAYDGSAIAVIVLFSLFAMVLFVGTIIDVCIIPRGYFVKLESSGSSDDVPKPGLLKNALACFSVYRNGKKLLSTKRSNDTMTCIHGMRLISMLWVILGHTYDYASMMPIKNPLDIKATLNNIAFNVVLNGTYSVDTFLFLTGFLVTYLGLKQLKKTGGRLNIFLYYFHRYWRLTPVYAMVIALIAGPYYLMGSGPQWQSVDFARQNCQNYWWRNLLYINNLFDTSHMCVQVSWYISIDMQYYLIMPIVLLSLYKLPILGFLIIGILFFITTLTPALYIYYHDIPGYPSLQILFNSASPKAIDFNSNVYIKPYCRMGPYLVGVCLAYFLYKKEMRIRINWWCNVIGWVLATALGLTLIYGTYDYFDGDKVMSNAMNAVYGAFSRTAWSLCVAWVVFVCVTGNGGYVNSLLSWRCLIPLSRLTYCGYLLHLSVIILLFGTQEIAYYFEQYIMVILYCGFLVVVMGVSFIFSLAFESPMLELEKILFPWSRPVERIQLTPSGSGERRRARTSDPLEEIGETVCQEVARAQSSSYQNQAYVITEGETPSPSSSN